LFDGKSEHKLAHSQLSGHEILKQLDQLQDIVPSKHMNNRKRKRTSAKLNWTKKSIFFELPYWNDLLLRHNLDVMHVEKNICKNILGPILGVHGKSKDTIKAILDLEDMNIRKELHLKMREDGSYFVPPTCYTMSKKEKQDFCEFLKSVM